LRAASWAGTGTPVHICLGTHLSASLQQRSALARWLRVTPMRRIYARAASVIAVSEGVRQDTLALTGLPPERVHAVCNPVITPAMAAQAALPPPHPWLLDHAVPVIMGMGRLTRQKDFPTLLRAFARLRQQLPARLLILGEGDQRAALEALAGELGIRADMALPGFSDTPYAWLSRASLFVLSSAWEGSGNVLTEAMALGIPCVSTDCPSGPSEILDQGRHGRLVPVGDVASLSDAMLATLAAPPPAGALKAAVADFDATVSARRYLEVMGLLPD
jgi:glycosyltransferase involved in cell wall biosynthesis